MKIDSIEWRRAVIDGAAQINVSVSDEQARQLGAHANLLLEWNRVTNLTAITEPLEVALKHDVDALAAASWIEPGSRVLDAGAGGGFPGIPLAIVRPDLTFTLVDSVRKKVSFLKHALRTLGLPAVRAIHERLEVLAADPAHAGQYDLVVCRAFASLEDFARLTHGFLAPGGHLLALKGPQADHPDETDARSGDRLHLAGRDYLVTVKEYRLPVVDSRRRIIRLEGLGG